MVVARCERENAVGGHEPVGRLEAGDRAAGRRDADRPARVRAERGVCDIRGECRCRPAAGASRGAPGRSWIRNRAVVEVLRRDAVGELVQVRLADVRVPRMLEPEHRLGAAIGHVLGEDRRPVGRTDARRVEEILDREPNPGRRFELGDEDAVRHSRLRETSAALLRLKVCGDRAGLGAQLQRAPLDAVGRCSGQGREILALLVHHACGRCAVLPRRRELRDRDLR